MKKKIGVFLLSTFLLFSLISLFINNEFAVTSQDIISYRITSAVMFIIFAVGIMLSFNLYNLKNKIKYLGSKYFLIKLWTILFITVGIVISVGTSVQSAEMKLNTENHRQEEIVLKEKQKQEKLALKEIARLEKEKVAIEKKEAKEKASLEKKEAKELAAKEKQKQTDGKIIIQEEQRLAEENARIQEEQRQVEENARIQEEQRQAEENAKIQEEQRQVEENARIQEEQRLAEENARIQEEQRQAEENARIQEQQRQENNHAPNNPGAVNPNSATVYITQTGSKYHSHPNCGNSKTAYAVTLTPNIQQRYAPCKNCY